LKPLLTSADKDVFQVKDIDELYDTPIMYTVPDTASMQVGNCTVLVSVYSPNQQLRAKEIATWMSNLLDAARQYLGGKLPADKYAFLFYFKDLKSKHFLLLSVRTPRSTIKKYNCRYYISRILSHHYSFNHCIKRSKGI
jgi:predicted metalloprotease with PDZ domain